ncbi:MULTISPECIES: helix-turn-helix domain-containing protein [Pseudomonas aeruginosa group]|nr:helix-turn-helix transcriptional regulator [Pseudomonas aeruginosa]AVN45282.1 helix-turn-helix domain-containing protein [Pseudomonas aeruginosa]AZN01930.1 helix-turn-helix domain-containing protein [Pseudomonas aeruginosa]AZN04522.1 helix-turn-helix domain-containing protein [Pseudomonas aeruginosa]EIU5250370.1 helix-turn-helix domain-containing protein [Pseudomonas aeruginosa]EKU1206314.1 helix-turn-helix domain-containing protein [Pseudomonas aeruginosa]
MKYVHFDAHIQGENVSFDAHSGERLREERENAGLTQQQMADEAGVRREMWSKYERGVAAPGAAVFEALARKGLDLVFILTGMRQVQSAPLAPDERILLDNYRHSPPDAQAALKATSDAFARRTGKKAG